MAGRKGTWNKIYYLSEEEEMKLGRRSVVHQAVHREVCLHPAYVEGKFLVNGYAILLELYLSYS